VKPNFLFIGPDKSGSTWFYEILRQHPLCFVPVVKDVYFFDRYYDRGLAWYFAFFANAKADAKAIGELSHDYLFSPLAAKRIANDLPGVKLLTCLRNPAERTFSNWLQMRRNGETRLPFESALDAIPKLIDHSMYSKHLQAYFDLFPPTFLKVLLFDDLKADPTRFAADIFDFLNLPMIASIDYGKKVMAANQPRSYFAARLMKMGADLAREIGLPALVGKVKHSGLAKALYRPYNPHNRPQMAPDTRLRLVELFSDETRILEKMIGKDLRHWRQAP